MTLLFFVTFIGLFVNAPMPIEHSDMIYNAIYSPDGGTIITVSADNTGIIWNAETCQPIRQLTGHDNWMIDADYSPDGRHIATASWDNTVKIWNSGTGELLHTLTEHSMKLNDVTYSPYNGYLATTGKDNVTIIWDTETYQSYRVLHETNLQMNNSDFYYDPHSLHIIIANDSKATLWDYESPRKDYEIVHESATITKAIYSPDGKYIATTGYGGPVAVIWNASNLKQVKTIGGMNSGDVTNIAYSPSGKWLAVTTNSNPINQDYETIIYDIESNEIIERLSSHREPVITAHFSPDGKYLVTSSMDSTADIWDVLTWELKCTLGTPKPFDDFQKQPINIR